MRATIRLAAILALLLPARPAAAQTGVAKGASPAAASAATPTGGAVPAPVAVPVPGVANANVVPIAPPRPTLADVLTGQPKIDYEAARLLFGDRDYAGALVKFQSAYDQSKEPRLLYNVASCEKNLRHYVKTIAYLERYRAESGPSMPQSDRDDVDRFLGELSPFVGAVRVGSNEDGADVYVDNEKVGTTPLTKPVRVDIGQRRVRVTKDGFTELDTAIAVTGSSEQRVDARLERIVHAGRLVVHAEPKDSIFVDDQLMGTVDYEGMLSSGGHQIRVTAPGMQPYQSEVVIADHQARTVEVKLLPVPGKIPAWAWVIGSALVVGGATTAAVYFLRPQDSTRAGVDGSLSPGTVSLSSFAGLRPR